MSARPTSASPGPQWPGLEVTPVLPADPAKVGDFWLDGRIHARPSGIAWLGHDDGLHHAPREETASPGERVILVQLAAGAASDKAARDRFSGLVNQLHIDAVRARGGDEQDQGRLGHRFRAENDDPIDPDDAHPIAPWVALTYDDSPVPPATAERLLAEVDLLDLEPKGRPAGPDFRLHWFDRDGAGHNRTWPLPWPGRYDRAGWVSILASWLLMIALAALALLIAVLLFRNSEPQSPPPVAQSSPPPSSASASAGESASASPSEGSASPSEGASASPSPSESSSAQPTPNSSGSPGGGSPTPPSRL